MDNLMLDLETLGTYVTPVILSIGAVQFDIETGKIGKIFQQSININSSTDAGLTIDPATVKWWMLQNEEARKKFVTEDDNARSLKSVLNNFAYWLWSLNPHESDVDRNDKIKIWGRGPRMDLALLCNAYIKCGWQDPPWNFRNERCVRTMEMLAPEIKAATPREGVEHSPVDDCKYQIKYVSSIYKKLNTVMV